MPAGVESAPLDAHEIIIFGASGDLTKRKLLPALYALFAARLLPDRFVVVGYARQTLSEDAFRELAHDAIASADRAPHRETWSRFAERLRYVCGGYDAPGAMRGLVDELGRTGPLGSHARRLFYCATPPAAYGDIVARIAEQGLQRGSRIVVEKPFGADLRSSVALNVRLREVFEEEQIFRIDHYLGKETVQSILAFRFANGIFEPIWNRRYIDHVQISVAESIGIEGRGRFYDRTGAIRDMVSTHMFQMMTFVAMEPPVSFEPDRMRDETVKVLRATTHCDPSHVVRGQYIGYREEEGVNPTSDVETFAAMQMEIDTWRWSGVPFFLRTGKSLKGKVSEITLKFRQVPMNVFRGTPIDYLPKRDQLTFRLQPNEGISIAVNTKEPGPGLSLRRVTLDFELKTAVADAYELLLLEAMRGDQTLFLRHDAVEQAWELLDPLLRDPAPLVRYPAGGWGPVEADELIRPRSWYLWSDGSPSDARSRSGVVLGEADLLP